VLGSNPGPKTLSPNTVTFWGSGVRILYIYMDTWNTVQSTTTTWMKDSTSTQKRSHATCLRRSGGNITGSRVRRDFSLWGFRENPRKGLIWSVELVGLGWMVTFLDV
jgi:hypothetical protein